MSDISLYNITNGLKELMTVEDMTPEDIEKVKTILSEELVKKSANVIGYAKNLELTIDAIKAEIDRLNDNLKALKNHYDKYKEYVKDCMTNIDATKIETPLGILTVAKNPLSVDITNEEAIPDEFKELVTTVKIDKKKIAEHFKSTGELIEGCNIINDKTSLRIK